ALQGCDQHTAGTLPSDLVEHRSPVRLVQRRVVPDDFSMDAASFPPRTTGRRSIRREDTPPASQAPRSTTSGHTSSRPGFPRGSLSRADPQLLAIPPTQL